MLSPNTYTALPPCQTNKHLRGTSSVGCRKICLTSPKSERSRSRGDDRDKPKGLISSLFSAFKPASSEPVKNVFAKNRRMLPRQDNQPTAIFHPPRSPTPPAPPQLSTSSSSPEIIPIRLQREHHPLDREREARPGRRPLQLVELKDHSSGEDESPLPTILRRHQREPRSVSPIDRYEAEKTVTLEKERRRREESVVSEEHEALERATHLERYERPEREREEAKRRIEFEEKIRIESVERARRRDQREEYERQQARDRS